MKMRKDKINVLYVDDEQHNLVSFVANFRNIYNVYTAQSAAEGKEILKNKEINVLITDQRMPNEDGVQFLESILKEYPFPVRIILSGYADIGNVIGAINKGEIYRYVMKPFDVEELKLIINNAYDLHAFQKESKEVLSKYQYLFEKSNDAIFVVNENGVCEQMNLQGLNLLV
jgi:response regulator RpfG family c-di-GMP phosphodiesterase